MNSLQIVRTFKKRVEILRFKLWFWSRTQQYTTPSLIVEISRKRINLSACLGVIFYEEI